MTEWLTEELITGVREWLGEDGVAYFQSIGEEHGRIDAIWDEGGIPHPVHFREGVTVRNKLRELTNNSWTDHEYDNRWVAIIKAAL